MTVITVKSFFKRIYDSDVGYSFFHSPTAMLAAIIAFICIFCALFAPWVAPHNPFDLSSLELANARLPPAWAAGGNISYPLGDWLFGTLRRQLAVITEQQRYIQALSTPIIQIWDDIITLPLIGNISDDGYFGVDQTSERIFQFAVAIAGGDTSRIDAIKEGIDKGFAGAKKVLGNWLPQISYDTYDAVMNKLDKWVADAQEVAALR